MNPSRKYLAVTTTLFVTLGMVPSAPRASLAEAVPNAATTRVLSYNVCAERCPGLAPWSGDRVHKVSASIKRVQPDVAVVLEAGRRTHEVRELRAALSPEYLLAAGTKARYIFYRASTMSPVSGAGGTLSVRATARSKITAVPFQTLRNNVTGVKLLIVGIHLTALDGLGSDLARQAEMRQILAWHRSQRTDIPTVFAGDFNSYTQKPDLRYDSDEQRWRVHELLEVNRFRDAGENATVASNALHNSINPIPADRRDFGPGRHLDHLYVGADLTIAAWVLVNRDVPYAEQFSDHDFIFADLEYRNTPVTKGAHS